MNEKDFILNYINKKEPHIVNKIEDAIEIIKNKYNELSENGHELLTYEILDNIKEGSWIIRFDGYFPSRLIDCIEIEHINGIDS